MTKAKSSDLDQAKRIAAKLLAMPPKPRESKSKRKKTAKLSRHDSEARERKDESR